MKNNVITSLLLGLSFFVSAKDLIDFPTEETVKYFESIVDCQNITSSHDVSNCNHIDLYYSDKKMNELFIQLKNKINAVNDADLRTTYLRALLANQKSWIKYRDNQCRFYVIEAIPDSSFYHAEVSLCLNRLTQSRIQELLVMGKKL